MTLNENATWILATTIDILNDQGWGQGPERESPCLLDAVGLATDKFREDLSSNWTVSTTSEARAIGALRHVLDKKYVKDPIHDGIARFHDGIARWNDHVASSKEKEINVVREAAEYLRSEDA